MGTEHDTHPDQTRGEGSPDPDVESRADGKPRRRRWLIRLLALAGGLLLAALLLELLVVIFFGVQPKFPRHVVEAPWGIRYNEPGATYRHNSADVDITFRINDQGMRSDQNFAYEKPPGVYRIVSLGDSFTIGYEVEVEQTFSAVVEQELRAQGMEVEVLNAGVSGFSNAEELIYLRDELLKYDPDLVLVSFFTNDLVDNARTGLFDLTDEGLVQVSNRYVPAGGLGNFLNTNWFFNWLSERSNAFVLIKERATGFVNRARLEEEAETAEGDQRGSRPLSLGQLVDRARLAELEGGPIYGNDESDPAVHQARLAAAILDELFTALDARGIPLVIQSIPSPRSGNLYDLIPLEFFDTERSGVTFISSRDLLLPHYDDVQLYYQRSLGHWTPFAHDVVGTEIAKVIADQALLGSRG